MEGPGNIIAHSFAGEMRKSPEFRCPHWPGCRTSTGRAPSLEGPTETQSPATSFATGASVKAALPAHARATPPLTTVRRSPCLSCVGVEAQAAVEKEALVWKGGLDCGMACADVEGRVGLWNGVR